MPKLTGFELIQQLHGFSRYTTLCPIIVVSANNTEEAKIKALESGADGYITKPFSLLELLMRVKVALRRRALFSPGHFYLESTKSNWGLANSQVVTTSDGLWISKTARSVKLGQQVIQLRPKEFDLLWFLVSHPGQAFDRDQLLKEVWNYPPALSCQFSDDRNLRV